MLCLSADPAVVDTVSACAAALGRPWQVSTDPGQIRSGWLGAPVVFVGVDCAPAVLGAGLPARPGVFLCAEQGAEAAVWSVPLQAVVLLLGEDHPEGASQVSQVLLDVAADQGRARVVKVLGASGGLGVSTLVAGLALAAQRSGLDTAAAELATDSGGLDLLFGAERAPGWRWPDLARARGQLGEVRSHLPQSGGITVISAGRDPARPDAAARQAVLDSAQRGHQVVLLDLGRGDELPPGPGATLLLVGSDVHSLMAARHRLHSLGSAHPLIVVRRRGRRGIPTAEVATALGAPVLGQISDDRAVPAALELADQPGRHRGRFARQCQGLWQDLVSGQGWSFAGESR